MAIFSSTTGGVYDGNDVVRTLGRGASEVNPAELDFNLFDLSAGAADKI